jgi:hypothetical protein
MTVIDDILVEDIVNPAILPGEIFYAILYCHLIPALRS